MMNTIWKKAWRDPWVHKTRTLLVVGAIAASSFTLGTTLIAFHLLERDMNGSFLRAKPHNLSLSLDRVDQAILQELARLPEIEGAEARFVALGRIQNANGKWRPLQLFGAADFSKIKIDIMTPDSGPWPPKAGQISIERQALSVLAGSVGEKVHLELAGEVSETLEIGGLVHDVVLPQAEWENIVYGYVSLDTLRRLGIPPRLNQIKIRLAGNPSKEQALEKVQSLKSWLAERGVSLEKAHAAEPGQHPHHAITSEMFLILKIFGWFCCLFSCILVVSLLTSALAGEKRQIGVMKAMGGGPWQIARIYFTSVLCVGAVALCIGLPLILPAGLAMAQYFAKMMNFDIENARVPLWIFAVLLGVGLGLPLLICYWPIRLASRRSIQASLLDYGLGNRPFQPGALARLCAPWLSTPLLISARNTFRNKGRLLLNIGVLSSAAAFMITSLNLDATIAAFIDGVNRAKRWDLRVKLERPLAADTLQRVAALEEIKTLSPYFLTNAHLTDKPNQDFTLVGIDTGSPLLELSLLEGQRLVENPEEILIGQSLLDILPDAAVGDMLSLTTSLGDHRFRIKGIVASLGWPRVYVSQTFFRARQVDTTNRFYVEAAASHERAKRALTYYFEQQGIEISSITTPQGSIQAVIDHFEIIFRLIVLLTVFLGLISVNGIFSSMATSLLERTREIGILKAIGASRAMLLRIIVAEGIIMGLVGWLIAALAALPMSRVIAYQMGEVLLGTPLPLVLSPMGFLASLVLVPAVSALACLLPAVRCANRPVRDSLVYE